MVVIAGTIVTTATSIALALPAVVATCLLAACIVYVVTRRPKPTPPQDAHLQGTLRCPLCGAFHARDRQRSIGENKWRCSRCSCEYWWWSQFLWSIDAGDD